MANKKRFYFAPWEEAYQRIATPFEEFLHRQTTTGILLITCAIIALAIANSPLLEAYQHLLHMKMAVSIGNWNIEHTLHHWINDGLMTIFFFVVGLEIKREVLVGELSNLKNAILPVIGAIGGMVVPAALYLLVTGDGDNARGWGIPMATDIAFAVGVMALLGNRIPRSLLTFLVALAIVDDLGAVTVIALFYTATIDTTYLGAAVIIVTIMYAMNLMGIRQPLPYFLFAVLLWIAMEGSGIHATIAGIFAAWTIPAYSRFLPRDFSQQMRSHMDQFDNHNQGNQPLINNPQQSTLTWRLSQTITLGMSPLQKLESMLHIPSTYLVIPIFALANAAIPLNADSIGKAAESPIAWGIGAGLIFGKLIGVAGSVILAEMMGIGALPKGTQRVHIVGAGLLAGIGFTMSIFISELAFVWDGELVEQAKMGILAASLMAGLSGYILLRWFTPQPEVITPEP
ncbi:MAG: Na+/H+ antiporter NhaA [Gammaproteobacteria bacterium]|nr:Na+/H+ antiporter NhaA [Gammaproteobacteria bacterium]